MREIRHAKSNTKIHERRYIFKLISETFALIHQMIEDEMLKKQKNKIPIKTEKERNEKKKLWDSSRHIDRSLDRVRL